MAAIPLCAESAQERGKRAIDDCVAALGGGKFLAVDNVVETGRAYSFYREQLQGLSIAKIYTRYYDAAPPSGLKVRERQAFGKKEDSIVLFLDNAAYQLTYRGAKPLASDRLTRYRESMLHNIFYIFRERLHEPGMIFESQGSEVYSNMPVEVVDIIDAENRTVTVYFNRTTKLPVREVFTRRDPETKEKIEEVTLFSKFRDVGGGVQWPYDMLRERNGEKVFEIFSESVVINQELSDALFTLPSGMKLLKNN